MSKRKHKKSQGQSEFLVKVSADLDKKYVDLIEEVQFMQAELKRETKKAKRKQLKKLKKGGGFYSTVDFEREVRHRLINEMEGTDFFTRAANIISELKPVCIVIAKLVMALIVAILSIDSIKYTIKPATLHKLNGLYSFARSVTG